MGLAQKTFGEIINFTRNSAATRFNHLGRLETVAANQPRIDYNPVTRISRGVLIEGQRTNFVIKSGPIAGNGYIAQGGITTNANTSPDETLTASKLYCSAGEGSMGRYAFVFSPLGPGGYVFSVYAKAAEWRRLACRVYNGDVYLWHATIDITNGNVITGGGNASAEYIGNDWWRCSFRGVTAHNINTLDLECHDKATAQATELGDGYSGIYVWGAQLEAEANSTSYIPTSGSQATRAADAPIVPLGPWVRAQEGSFYARFFAPPNTGERVVFDLSNGSAAERLKLTVIDGTLRLLVTAGGIEQANISLGAVTPGANVRCALRYAANDIAAVVNNGTVQTDTSAVLPVATTLRLGHDPFGNHLNSVLADFDFFPRAMTNAQLQALTA